MLTESVYLEGEWEGMRDIKYFLLLLIFTYRLVSGRMDIF